MDQTGRTTLGLALSGGGNRSTFYVGFLEVFQEAGVKIDYIAACSGGSLVAAAFVCGTLPEFKKEILRLDKDSLKTYFTKGAGQGGLYSLDLLEEKIREFTGGRHFEDIRPLMGFVAADIETGEKIVLSMGDIARAARISCTIPGIFEPVKWGGRTLVDGGLLSMVPGDVLKSASMDFSVGVNMRGTRHIFTEKQIAAKRIFNFLKKILLVDEIEDAVGAFIKPEDDDFEKNPKLFSVLGKSLDLAILANRTNNEPAEACDYTITPKIPKLKNGNFSSQWLEFYYREGRKSALEHLPIIKKLIAEKTLAPIKIKNNAGF